MASPLATAFVRIKMLVDPAAARADVEAGPKAADLGRVGESQGKILADRMSRAIRDSKITVPVDADTSKATTAGKTLTAAMQEQLRRADVKLPVSADTKGAEANVTVLQKRLADLSKKVTEFKIKGDDTAGAAAIARMNVSLDKLNVKVAKPGIDLKGEHEALAGIAAVELAMDRLDKKKATPKIDTAGIGKGVLGGIGPGILGVGALGAGAVAAGGLGLAALPAAVALHAAGGVAGAGIGVISAGAEKLIGQKNTAGGPNTQGPLFNQAAAVTTAMQTAMKTAAQGMLAPLKSAFGQIPGMIKAITPALTAVFAGAGTMIAPLLNGINQIAKVVLPLMGQAFRAVSPLIAPVMSGLAQLAAGVLPGLITMLHAAKPAIDALSGILGTLGRDLGTAFTAMAPAVAASSVIFKALGDVLAAIFPIIGKLAAVFATALAPVFAQFAGVIKSLLPVLSILGGVLAEFAKAVLADLVAAFSAVATVLKAVGPALGVLATSIGSVFTMLENTGVFAMFGDALEAIALPLGKLIAVLIQQLAPLLPVVIRLVSQLGGILITVLAAGLGAALTAVTFLLVQMPFLLPVIVALVAGLKGIAIVKGIIEGAKLAMTAFKEACILTRIQLGLLAIQENLAAIRAKALAVGQWLLNAAMDANPIGIIVIALAALAAAFYLAWTHSATFRNIVIGAFNAVKDAVLVVLNWFKGPFASFFTTTLPNVFIGGWSKVTAFFSTVAAAVEKPFNDIKNWVTSNFDTWWKSNGDAIKAIWAAIWGSLLAIFHATFDPIVAAAKLSWAILQAAFQAGSAIVRAVWSALWAGLLALYHQFFDPIVAAARGSWVILQALFTAGTAVLKAVWQAAWLVIQTVTQAAWGVIQALFRAGIAVLTAAWNLWLTVLTNAGRVFWAAIQLICKVAWDILVGIFTVAINLLTGRWGAAWTAMKNTAVQIWNALQAFFGTWWTAIKGNFSAALTFLESILTAAWNAIRSSVATVFNAIRGFFDTWWAGIKSGFQGLVNGIQTVWNTVKGVAAGPIHFIADVVYDQGIVPVVNAVGGLIGLHLNAITVPFAAGGRVTAGTGPTADDVLARVSRDETVVSAAHSRVLAPAFSALGVPGYAAGGIPFADIPGYAGGGIPFIGGILGDIAHAVGSGAVPGSGFIPGKDTVSSLANLTGDALAAAASAILDPLLNAVPTFSTPLGRGLKEIPKTIIEKLIAVLKATSAAGGDIVADAKSWIGKIPYVWGGSTLGPGGADCSGFTQAIYGRHGISAPRTSEAQGAWVKRGSPTAGGLAFYHSPGGGADPGHVAIVADASWVVSQGGGMGPKMMALHGMPLLWTGIPPGGLPKSALGAGAGPAGSAAAGSVKALAQSTAAALGWTGALWNDINALEMAEAGWNLNATNPSSGAYGIAQFINGASEYAQYGGNSGSAAGQITGFYNYIAQRYGNPAAAWAHEQAYHWYGGGGTIVEPIAGVGLRTGSRYMFGESGPETVTPGLGGAGLGRIEALLEQLIGTTAAVPAATGAHLGDALGGAAHAASFRSRYPNGGW